MAALRNTLFMRLLEQQDVRQQKEAMAQQSAAAAGTGVAGNALETARTQQTADQNLATGLGAAAGAVGEEMPIIQDQRLAEYAKTGYQPAAAKQQQQQQSTAAEFMQL